MKSYQDEIFGPVLQIVRAETFEEALAARDKLKSGEVIYTPQGHAVTGHSVSFYAQDSEQAGLLARQQEIENLEKQLRAQTLIAEEARSALVRAEAAYTDASQRLVTVRREASDTQARAHELQVEALRLTQLAEQTRARSEQIAGDLAEVDAALEELQERRVTAEARFEANRQRGSSSGLARSRSRGSSVSRGGIRSSLMTGKHNPNAVVCARANAP
jgi:chromosome segregation ATPase